MIQQNRSLLVPYTQKRGIFMGSRSSVMLRHSSLRLQQEISVRCWSLRQRRRQRRRGDGGVSWGDGANDEANQTLWERPGELRAAAADVRGDVPRRSGRGILRLLLGHLGRGVLRQQTGQLGDGLGQAEAGRVGPGRHWVLPRDKGCRAILKRKRQQQQEKERKKAKGIIQA